MQSINIRMDNGKMNVIVDGTLFRDVHSFSLDYIRGVPLLFACVADIGPDGKERQEPKFMS